MFFIDDSWWVVLLRLFRQCAQRSINPDLTPIQYCTRGMGTHVCDRQQEIRRFGRHAIADGVLVPVEYVLAGLRQRDAVESDCAVFRHGQRVRHHHVTVAVEVGRVHHVISGPVQPLAVLVHCQSSRIVQLVFTSSDIHPATHAHTHTYRSTSVSSEVRFWARWNFCLSFICINNNKANCCN